LAAFKEFRSAGVVVFANANSETDYQSLPAGAKAARKDSGNTIPMVFVTTADGAQSIKGISYDAMKKDIRDVDRELRKHLKTVNVTGATKEEPEEAGADGPAAEAILSEPSVWTNADGKEIMAAVKLANDSTVIFMIDGREVPYPLVDLSPESRLALQELVNQ
jgi:hypothetical protein